MAGAGKGHERESVKSARRESLSTSAVSRRVLPLLVLLLAGSGCAALIYEIVWFQLLQLVIGSSGVSLGLLLAAYMGGLCAGSLLLQRFVPPRIHPLKVYAVLEIGIGILGLLVLFAVPLVARVYVAGVPESMTAGLMGLILRGIVAGACLLPPTILMGASLPAIARWLETTPKGISWLGLLYSGNIAGAVFGCFLSGFYLLRIYDMATATYAAVGINIAVAAASFVLSMRTDHADTGEDAGASRIVRIKRVGWVYLAIAISGLSALGAEVVWTRLLSLLLGGTVYTFSIILAVFLCGLWFGSSAGAFAARRSSYPVVALAVCQIGLILWIGWTAYALAYSLPYWPVDPWLSLNPLFNFQLDLVRCIWAISPATFLWGASFPLALAAAAKPGEDPAKLSGEVYAANTAGSIVGALAFSLFFIPGLGTRVSQQILIALAAAGAIAAAVSSARIRTTRTGLALGLTAVALSAVLIYSVHDVPWEVIAYGRRIAPTIRAADLYPEANVTKVLFRGEGINSSVVIAERSGVRQFYVSGKAEASSAPADMRLERMMGHVPALLHPNPRSVLTVGFGAGVTAGSFVPYPDVESLIICELESLIPPASTQFFSRENYSVMHDPRTRIVYDDARHFIFTTKQKFDVVTTDPIHPWVKGTSTLYSKEYYELVKEHLNPGGVVAQWLPIYDSDPATVKSEFATFFDVFPNGTVWSNYTQNEGGYDLVLIGGNTSAVDVDAIQARLDRPDYSKVLASISEVGFHSGVEILATYAGRASDLKSYLAGAQINDDMNLRLQYLAGLGVNSMAFQKVFADVVRYRKFPEDLFHGSEARLAALRTLLRSRR